MATVYKSDKQKALEEFLNDEVEKLAPRLFKWRGRLYEVVSYQSTLKKHNWSQYVKIGSFMMREMTNETIKKYFPKHAS